MITNFYYFYLDLPSEVPLGLLVPVSRKLFLAFLGDAFGDDHRPLVRRVDDAHATIAKCLS